MYHLTQAPSEKTSGEVPLTPRRRAGLGRRWRTTRSRRSRLCMRRSLLGLRSPGTVQFCPLRAHSRETDMLPSAELSWTRCVLAGSHICVHTALPDAVISHSARHGGHNCSLSNSMTKQSPTVLPCACSHVFRQAAVRIISTRSVVLQPLTACLCSPRVSQAEPLKAAHRRDALE